MKTIASWRKIGFVLDKMPELSKQLKTIAWDDRQILTGLRLLEKKTLWNYYTKTGQLSICFSVAKNRLYLNILC